MADNTVINTGSGGDTIATDDIGGTKYPRSKIVIGADGVNDGDVSSANPLPVSFGAQSSGGTATDPPEYVAVVIAGASGSIDASCTQGGGSPWLVVQSGSWEVTILGSVAVSSVSGVVDVTPESPAANDYLPVRLTDGSSFIGANFSTLAEQQSQTTSLQLIDDVVATTGSAIPSKGVAISGTDGTNARVIKTDSSGIVAQPARARTTDTMSVAVSTDAIMSATTALTPKFAKISTASSGNSSLVALVSAKKIRVTSMFLVANAAVTVYFRSGGGTAICGDGTNGLSLAANSGFVLPFNPVGYFESASGEALEINLSGAIIVAGSLTYVEV